MRAIFPAYALKDGRPFPPSEPQRLFHRMKCLNRYFRGGLGAGKSKAGANETMWSVMANAEWRTAQRHAGVRQRRQGLEYIIAAPTYDLVEAGALFHIGDWLDQFAELNGKSLIDREWETPPRRIRLVTGDTLRFVTLKKPKQFAGRNAAGCWLDEAELADDPVAAFMALRKRIRDTAVPSSLWFMLVTSTNEGNRGVSAFFDRQIAKGDTDYGLVKGGTLSNPGADRHYYDGLRATMSQREINELLHAETEAEDGAVFRSEYHRHESMVDWEWLGRPRRDCEYYVAIDWESHYHALFIEHHPLDVNGDRCKNGGKDIVFDELAMDGVQDGVFLDAVFARLRKWGIPQQSVKAWADYFPRPANEVANTRRYFDGQCYSERVGAGKRDGINTVRWRLCDASGNRRLFVARRLITSDCPRGVVQSLGNYSYEKAQIDGNVVYLPNVNQESPWSHACDALRAYCWPRYRHLRILEADRQQEVARPGRTADAWRLRNRAAA